MKLRAFLVATVVALSLGTARAQNAYFGGAQAGGPLVANTVDHTTSVGGNINFSLQPAWMDNETFNFSAGATVTLPQATCQTAPGGLTQCPVLNGKVCPNTFSAKFKPAVGLSIVGNGTTCTGVAAALVQQATPVAPASVSTYNIVFGSTPIVGNLVVIETSTLTGSTNSLSGEGCSWTQVDQNNLASGVNDAIWACNVVTPGTTVAITLSGTVIAGGAGQEFSGFTLGTTQFSHSSNPSGVTTDNVTTPTANNANSLLIANLGLNVTQTTAQITSPTGSWITLNSVNGANGLSFAQSYQIQPSTTGQSTVYSWVTSSGDVILSGVIPPSGTTGCFPSYATGAGQCGNFSLKYNSPTTASVMGFNGGPL